MKTTLLLSFRQAQCIAITLFAFNFITLQTFDCNAQIVNIPDANFKAALVGNASINTNGDGEIQLSEATTFADTIDVSFNGIVDLTGIEFFTAITYLDCGYNQLSSLDVSANIALTWLVCWNNQLTSLNVSANTALSDLNCINNQLTSLNVSANTALINLNCGGNQLTSLNVSANTFLTNLYCFNNQLTSMDVSANTVLTGLNCGYNKLTSLDVSANTTLTVLGCNNNQLTSLYISANSILTELHCGENKLTNLNVSMNTALIVLSCNYNQLASLNVSANTALSNLSCGWNKLTSLDVKNGNNNNMYFYAKNNPNLTCINVDDSIWSTANWSNKDAWASFSDNCTSGISELINTTEIKNYPNPTTGKLAVSLSNGNIGTIEIYNLIGEKVYANSFNQQKPALSKVEGSTEIDISNSPSGIYFLKVSDGVKVYTSKIVVQ